MTIQSQLLRTHPRNSDVKLSTRAAVIAVNNDCRCFFFFELDDRNSSLSFGGEGKLEKKKQKKQEKNQKKTQQKQQNKTKQKQKQKQKQKKQNLV